jgi:uncharacterized protein (DUF111 family)
MTRKKTVETHNHEQHNHHADAGHHNHSHGNDEKRKGKSVLTIRSHSGLSGDMFLAGLMYLLNIDDQEIDHLLASFSSDLVKTVRLQKRQVKGIYGWSVDINLPHRHEHRKLDDITVLINASTMSDRAKQLAVDTFSLLAQAEATVHGKKPEEIHFHEVGALDSIVDICLTCELFTRIDPGLFIVSPLPIGDGEVVCAHGILPVPAPAVLELLKGIPVCSFAGRGETVTPTAVALLHSLGANFGPWPAMQIENRALVYGKRVFSNAPNGTIFAHGTSLLDTTNHE